MTTIPDLRGTMTLPRVAVFPAQPVLVLRANMAMDELDTKGPACLDAVLAHLAAHGIAETGPAFFRYDVIDMTGTMAMSFGAQVAAGTKGQGDILAETLPAGRYVTTLHHGHPDELYDATIMLIEWSKVRGVRWDVQETAKGDVFAARMELFRGGPDLPKADWTTEIRIRLAD